MAGKSSRSGGSKSGSKSYRSASTGRYVKESTAKRNPGGTVGETRKK